MSTDTIIRGWRARLYPNREQARLLDSWANHCRGLWNKLLGAVVEQYKSDGKFLWKKELRKLAVTWKNSSETAWIAELPAHAIYEVCDRIDSALRRMVRERKAGRRCGFPRFRKKRWDEGSIYFINQRTYFRNKERCVHLPKLGMVKLRGGKLPTGRLLASRAVRDGNCWVLAAQLECLQPEPLPATGVRIGVDAGLSALATTYDGQGFESVAPPRPLRKALRRLRRQQRRLARRQKGSARRRAQVKRVADLHRTVRCRRADFLHKLSHRLTTKADVLVVETLDVQAMSRSLRLGKSVADAGIGTLLRQLAYKADWRGRALIQADKWYPSTKLCCRCQQRHAMPLAQRVMRCDCGNTMGRDENAAVNLYRYPEERENRGNAPTRGETGCQVAGESLLLVPVVEP